MASSSDSDHPKKDSEHAEDETSTTRSDQADEASAAKAEDPGSGEAGSGDAGSGDAGSEGPASDGASPEEADSKKARTKEAGPDSPAEGEGSSGEEDDEDDEDPESPPPVAKKTAGAKRTDKHSTSSGANKASSKKKSSKKRRRFEEPEEVEPVFSGRLVAATALCLAMVFIPLSPLGRIIAKESPQSQAREAWRVGTEGNVHITVITADFDKLNCADERQLEGMHCAYKDEKTAFPLPEDAPFDDNKKTVLQPYRTTDGQLLFMAGLWTQPEIAMRLHNEPARGVTEKKLARFVADCRVKFLEEWQGTKFRWAARGDWSSGETGMVARPLSCHIFEEGEE